MKKLGKLPSNKKAAVITEKERQFIKDMIPTLEGRDKEKVIKAFILQVKNKYPRLTHLSEEWDDFLETMQKGKLGETPTLLATLKSITPDELREAWKISFK